MLGARPMPHIITNRRPESDVSIVEGTTIRFRIPRGSTALPVLLRQLDPAAIVLESIEVHRPTLDDVLVAVQPLRLRSGRLPGWHSPVTSPAARC
jgi:ABC-2 type transport system ATP-binding protein